MLVHKMLIMFVHDASSGAGHPFNDKPAAAPCMSPKQHCTITSTSGVSDMSYIQITFNIFADCNVELRLDVLMCRKHFPSLGVIMAFLVRSARLSARANKTSARQIARPQSAHLFCPLALQANLSHHCIQLSLSHCIQVVQTDRLMQHTTPVGRLHWTLGGPLSNQAT